MPPREIGGKHSKTKGQHMNHIKESITDIEKNPEELAKLLNDIEEVLFIYIVAIREYRKKHGIAGRLNVGAK